nr:hypothetical protein [Pelotalea chapellei]
MAGPTTFPSFHLRHTEVGIVMGGSEERIVAISTGVHFEMFTMAEDQVSEARNLYVDIASRVTSGAIGELHAIGTAGTLMAGAARFSLFHVCH